MKCDAVDAIAVGESESLFSNFLGVWNNRSEWRSINGLASRSDEGIRYRRQKRLSNDALASLSPPEWSLFPLDLYRRIADESHITPYLPVEMGRGCPHRCVFCAVGIVFSRKRRVRPQDRVVADLIDARTRFGYSRFSFNDDNAGGSTEYVLNVCQAIKHSLQHEIEFTLALRPDSRLFERSSNLVEMAESGLREVFLGCESEDPVVMRQLQKTKRPEMWRDQIQHAVSVCRDVGIATRTNWIVGLPYQTSDSFLRTIEFICEISPDTALLSVLQPYPGTPIADLIHSGSDEIGIRLLTENLANYNAARFDPPIETRWLSRGAIIDLAHRFLREVGSESIANVSGSPYYLFEMWREKRTSDAHD